MIRRNQMAARKTKELPDSFLSVCYQASYYLLYIFQSDLMKFSLPKILKILVVLVCLLVVGVLILVRIIQGPGPETVETVLRYKEIPFPHTFAGDLETSLPFLGLATVDVDGDGVDEIIVGGGNQQADAVFRYTDEGFVPLDVTGLEKADGEATFGIASIDTNGDGREELFLARESGVYYAENIDGHYKLRRLEFGMDPNTIPLSIALGDFNRDGWVDLYISGYITLEAAEGETNFSDGYGGFSYLLLNDGSNHWKDISQAAGVFRQHNTFVAVFVDLNQDRWPDLVVAQDTGKVEIWENLHNNTFRAHPGITDYAYPMGIGVGDIDNDGDVDLYFSNVGNTLPRMMVQGNLTESQILNMDYILLRNDGDFRFTDIARETHAANYGFGWGTTIEDFNNDGRQDLYFSQNYARFPGVNFLKLYPGRLLEQQEDGRFLSVEKNAGLVNEQFGITQVVSDFNQDGLLDLVIANVNGPTRAFLGKSSGPNRGISVRLPSGPLWLNTVGVLEGPDRAPLTRQFVAGEGLCSDGFNGIHFGVGEATGPVALTLTRPDGEVFRFEDLRPGTQFQVKP